MTLVNVWNTQGRKHENQDDMAEDEVSSKHAEFSDLAEEFTARLRQRMPTHAVPFTSPPGNVSIILSEFSCQGKANDEFEDKSLDGSDSNHSSKCTAEREALKEKHDFKEDEEADNSESVGNGSEDGTKFLAAHAENGAHTTGHAEHTKTDTCVECDRAKSNKTNTDKGVGWLNLMIGIVFLSNTSLSVDEEVRNESYSNKHQWADNFTEEDVGELGSWDVTGELLRWGTKDLALVTSDSCTRETAIGDPRGGVRTRVTTGQPSQIVTVINEEVIPRELVRVEQEGRNAESKERYPEVQQARQPDGGSCE